MCDARCLPSASPRCAKILHRLRAALGARGGGEPAGGGAGGGGGLGDIQGLGCVPGAALGGRFSGFGSWAGLLQTQNSIAPKPLLGSRADRCSRAATQDKAVKRYVVRNIVDAASLRDITEACAIEGAPPRIQPAAKHTHARLRECWEPRAGRGCAEGRTGLCQLAAAAVTRPRASADLPSRR